MQDLQCLRYVSVLLAYSVMAIYFDFQSQVLCLNYFHML